MSPVPVERSVVERVASIMGPQSGAANALAHADELGTDAEFFRDGSYWVVGVRQSLIPQSKAKGRHE